MIKCFCDKCEKEIKEPIPVQIDLFDIMNIKTNLTQHERYEVDLCKDCAEEFAMIVKSFKVNPTINPYG